MARFFLKTLENSQNEIDVQSYNDINELFDELGI